MGGCGKGEGECDCPYSEYEGEYEVISYGSGLSPQEQDWWEDRVDWWENRVVNRGAKTRHRIHHQHRIRQKHHAHQKQDHAPDAAGVSRKRKRGHKEKTKRWTCGGQRRYSVYNRYSTK